MADTSNRRKALLLGEPYGTAAAKLRKALLFDLAGRCGLLVCYRCGLNIEDASSLSIEHKESWQRAADPRATYFDLGNIAFSHLGCNVSSADRSHVPSGYNRLYDIAPPGTAHCAGCREFLPADRFYRNVRNKNRHGLHDSCKECYRVKRKGIASRRSKSRLRSAVTVAPEALNLEV